MGAESIKNAPESTEVVSTRTEVVSSFKTQYTDGKEVYFMYAFNPNILIILDERRAQYTKVVESHPGKIPVIVERAPNAKNVPEIDKSKYLVPEDLTVAQFIYLIRKRIKLNNDQALFIYINGQLPISSALFSQIYEENKDTDGFLYVVYTGESSFGYDLWARWEGLTVISCFRDYYLLLVYVYMVPL